MVNLRAGWLETDSGRLTDHKCGRRSPRNSGGCYLTDVLWSLTEEKGTSMSQLWTSHAKLASFPVLTELPQQQESDASPGGDSSHTCQYFPLGSLRVRVGGKNKPGYCSEEARDTAWGGTGAAPRHLHPSKALLKPQESWAQRQQEGRRGLRSQVLKDEQQDQGHSKGKGSLWRGKQAGRPLGALAGTQPRPSSRGSGVRGPCPQEPWNSPESPPESASIAGRVPRLRLCWGQLCAGHAVQGLSAGCPQRQLTAGHRATQEENRVTLEAWSWTAGTKL